MTQLLVETAERTAADIPGFNKVVTSDLLRKEALVSLQLGAHLIAMLQKRYKTPPLVLAAYNAGEEAVDHWVKSRGYLPTDEFIEEIPFDETRGYVKRILSTWQIYRALAGIEPPPLALGRAYRPVDTIAKGD
jgi:soluble lytic murein transglycosylase